MGPGVHWFTWAYKLSIIPSEIIEGGTQKRSIWTGGRGDKQGQLATERDREKEENKK